MKKAFTAILVAAFCATALHAGAFELETVEPLQTDISHETETESVLSASITPGANVLTGNKNLLTFDNAGDEDVSTPPISAGKKIVDRPLRKKGRRLLTQTANTAK